MQCTQGLRIKVNSSLLISPVEYDDFVKSYWETQPLHVSRKDTNHFSDLLSVDGIKSFINDNAVIFPDALAVNSRSSIPVSDYTNDQRRVNADQLFKQHEQGGTIIVNEVHKKFAAVRELCVHINRDYQLRCQANAYLSPPGNQGFHSHYDTHDVFVLQVAGRKTFRFYPSDIELPFTDDTFHPDDDSEGEVVEQVELSAGDTLYIPRGIVHDALASEGEPSLHITLGVFPFVIRDLLQEMIQVAAERDVKLRRSVELSASDGAAASSQRLPLNVFKEGDVFNEEIYAEAVSRLADQVAVDCHQVAMSTGTFEAVTVEQIDADTVVTVNHSAIHGTEYRDGLFKLRLAGQVVQFTEPLSAAIANLLDRETMKAESLPGLDVEQQLALCHQLVALGVVDIR